MSELRLSEEEFNLTLDSHIDMRACPKCQRGGILRIAFSHFGPSGVRSECSNDGCGLRGNMFKITEFISTDSGRCATPVTPQSLLEGIKKAIEHWNNREMLE